MLTGNLPATSNREDLRFTVKVTDKLTRDPIDLTGSTINIAIRPQSDYAPNSATGLAALTGSSADGKITITDAASGICSVVFLASDMRTLCAGEHDVGITALLSTGATIQIAAVKLPVLDGVVS